MNRLANLIDCDYVISLVMLNNNSSLLRTIYRAAPSMIGVAAVPGRSLTCGFAYSPEAEAEQCSHGYVHDRGCTWEHVVESTFYREQDTFEPY